MATIWGSSMTDPRYSNYQGSQTYNFKPIASKGGTPVNAQGLPQLTGSSSVIPTNNGGGGGGGGGGDNNPPAPPPGFTTPEGNWYEGSMDQYMAEIQNAYNAGMGYWNTAEQNLNKNLGIMKGQAQSDYEANVGQLGATKQSTMTGLETQKRSGQARKEDAMAAARRLYNELQMANRQRFGGASSAGLAASEIQGAETQWQMGQTWRQANEFFQQIEGQKQNVEAQYQAGLLQLEQAKQQALSSAQLDFNNAITQIAAGRAQTEQERSQARLNALMDLRNKAFTIQQQDITFKQQLEAMRQQAMLNIETYNKTSGTALANATNANTNLYNQTTLTPSNAKVGGGSTQSTSTQPVGQIDNTKSGNWWDWLFNNEQSRGVGRS